MASVHGSQVVNSGNSVQSTELSTPLLQRGPNNPQVGNLNAPPPAPKNTVFTVSTDKIKKDLETLNNAHLITGNVSRSKELLTDIMPKFFSNVGPKTLTEANTKYTRKFSPELLEASTARLKVPLTLNEISSEPVRKQKFSEGDKFSIKNDNGQISVRKLDANGQPEGPSFKLEPKDGMKLLAEKPEVVKVVKKPEFPVQTATITSSFSISIDTTFLNPAFNAPKTEITIKFDKDDKCNLLEKDGQVYIQKRGEDGKGVGEFFRIDKATIDKLNPEKPLKPTVAQDNNVIKAADLPHEKLEALPVSKLAFYKTTTSERVNVFTKKFNEIEEQLKETNKKPGEKPLTKSQKVDLIKDQLVLLQKAQHEINSKSKWSDDKVGKVEKLEKAIVNQAIYLRTLLSEIDSKSDQVEGGIVVADPFAPKALKNDTPSKWMRMMSDIDIPDFTGMKGHGSGKQGGQGSTFNFTTTDGRELLGKVNRSGEKTKDETQREYHFYQTVYDKVGRHPNLGNVYGWADLKLGKQHDEGMIMDKIPGMDGRAMQRELKEALDSGMITQSEYWGAIQYVGRTLVNVTEHIHKAGLAHNDIKPENYMVDNRTGDVILIDLGGAQEFGKAPGAATREYVPPEFYELMGQGRNHMVQGTEKSDVFTIGSTLLHATEAPQLFHGTAQPNQGLTLNDKPTDSFVKDKDKNNVKVPFASTSTKDKNGVQKNLAYVDFMAKTMDANKDNRSTLASVKNSAFLTDSLLDDNGAKKILKGIVDGSIKNDFEKKWMIAGAKAKGVSESSIKFMENNPVSKWKENSEIPPLKTLRESVPKPKEVISKIEIREQIGGERGIIKELKDTQVNSSPASISRLITKGKELKEKAELVGIDTKELGLAIREGIRQLAKNCTKRTDARTVINVFETKANDLKGQDYSKLSNFSENIKDFNNIKELHVSVRPNREYIDPASQTKLDQLGVKIKESEAKVTNALSREIKAQSEKTKELAEGNLECRPGHIKFLIENSMELAQLVNRANIDNKDSLRQDLAGLIENSTKLYKAATAKGMDKAVLDDCAELIKRMKAMIE
jgi:serine/threonine protein kinase